MKLVITGALGHIGSRLIHEIPAGMFHKVDLLDNLSTQRYPVLFDLPEDLPTRFFEEDILTADLEKYFEGASVVVHLAAITNAEASVDAPEEVERTNYQGTERVARACADCGSKLIFLSTTSVYGVQEDQVDEDCPVEQLQPQSPYAASKLKAEFMLQDMGRRDGLDFVICRFGTIFGVSTGMRFHTAVNKFCWQAAIGQPLTVWKTALNQKRPYLDLGDAVEALKFIIERDYFDRSLYNVVTANATVKDIVDQIAEHVPDLAIQYVDSPIMNQLSYEVANRRFTDLGFQFKGSLEEGIAATMKLLAGVRHSGNESRGYRRDE